MAAHCWRASVHENEIEVFEATCTHRTQLCPNTISGSAGASRPCSSLRERERERALGSADGWMRGRRVCVLVALSRRVAWMELGANGPAAEVDAVVVLDRDRHVAHRATSGKRATARAANERANKRTSGWPRGRRARERGTRSGERAVGWRWRRDRGAAAGRSVGWAVGGGGGAVARGECRDSRRHDSAQAQLWAWAGTRGKWRCAGCWRPSGAGGTAGLASDNNDLQRKAAKAAVRGPQSFEEEIPAPQHKKRQSFIKPPSIPLSRVSPSLASPSSLRCLLIAIAVVPMKRTHNEVDGDVVIKARLGSDIRRFQLPREGGFDSLLALLNQIYDSLPANCFVKYKDDEGDLVSVTSDEELEEALRLAAEQSSKVLYLSLFPLSSTVCNNNNNNNNNNSSSSNAPRTPPREDDNGTSAGKEEARSSQGALVRSLSKEFAEQLDLLTKRTAELCLAAATTETTSTSSTSSSSSSSEDSTATSMSVSATTQSTCLAGGGLESLQRDISAQLIEQLNALALDAHPNKREYRYDIVRSSTLEPTTESGRRDAFTRLTMDTVKRAKFEKAIEEAADKMLAHELQKLQESKAPRRNKKRKQRAKLCPSCPRCTEPMSEREPPPDAATLAADPLAAYRCTSTTCSFSQPAKTKLLYVYHF